MKEIWKEIDYGYSVSNLGRVKNKFNNIKNLSLHHRGYIVTRYHKSMYSVHRLVAKAFIPNQDNKPEVNHIDGNKQNNHVSNLEWCTRRENQLHAYRTSLRTNEGDSNPNSKLNWDMVNEIRKLYNTGLYKQIELGKMYNISQSVISKVVLQQNWSREI